MAYGVRWYLAGSVVLGVLAVLAGCSGHNVFVQREQWRHDAEVECLGAGAVKEGTGLVRIKPITGPGMCGADFPLKVSMLAENTALGYGDEVRPPGGIPNSSGAPKRWPIAPAGAAPPPPPAPAGAPNTDQPLSLRPPGAIDPLDNIPEVYDFRRPYGGGKAPSQPSGVTRTPLDAKAQSPNVDFSPVPYERRPMINEPSPARDDSPAAVSRMPVREPPYVPAARAPAREPPPVVPMRPAPSPPVTGSIGSIAVSPAATLACPIVSALDHWILDYMQPAAMRWFGQPVVEIHQISAYSCRGMNGDPNAHISEHAFGNALDIEAFILADGHKIRVQYGWRGAPEEQGFLRDIQGAACDLFTTVLAPGSNVYHYNHIHVDLMRRKGGRRACNPKAVSGEEVASRARGQLAGRRGEPSVTGSVNLHKLPSPAKRLRSNVFPDERSDRNLPYAVPGEDGQED